MRTLALIGSSRLRSVKIASLIMVAGHSVSCRRSETISPVPPASTTAAAPASTTAAAPSSAPRVLRAETPPAHRGIVWTMTANPDRFRMAEREDFRLEITAFNDGDEVADTHRDGLGLDVNGESSTSFRLNWGNGHRDRRWRALAPGERVVETRPFGTAFFRAAGEHILVLKRDGVEVARVAVVVDE